MRHKRASSVAILLVSVWAGAANAKVSAEESARLGQDLTPIGAEKAASVDGSIPEWAGGLPQHGELVGYWPQNLFKDDAALYTITGANLAQYRDQLSAGHQALLQRYPSYKMTVYPSRRSVAFPQAIYDATKANAATTFLEGGKPDGLRGARLGFPFPIPQTGAELIWNHRLKYRGEAVRRYNNQAIVLPSGSITLTKLVEDVIFPYGSMKNPQPFDKPDSVSIYYLSNVVAPPRVAGQFLLAWEHPEDRSAWIYNPALRRIRRAPSVAYDNPYEGTDGNQFYDQVDMFNGALDRYTWKLVGKREMIVGYNPDRMIQQGLKYGEIVKKSHLNQDLGRYELHRVWIVEADNVPGLRHSFKKRVMYIDEDSWTIAMVDCYDQRDQLWKFQEGHLLSVTNIQFGTTVPETIYDLQSGGYFVTTLFTEDKSPDFSVTFDKQYFTPDNVKKGIKR
ncbi:MAG: DUF1329 domain-containing protein [Nevskiales bacterium]